MTHQLACENKYMYIFKMHDINVTHYTLYLKITRIKSK